MTMASLKVILIWLTALRLCCTFMTAVAFPTGMIKQQRLRGWCPCTRQQEQVMVGNEMVAANKTTQTRRPLQLQQQQQNPIFRPAGLFSSKINLAGMNTKAATINCLVALRGGAAATAVVLSAISSSPPSLIK